MRDKPKECINSKCKNVFYVPKYLLHHMIRCETCYGTGEIEIEE
jgi:hypothetical protein